MTSLPTPAEWLARFPTGRPCDTAKVATVKPPSSVAGVAASLGGAAESRTVIGEPLVLRDGRRLWRIRAGRGGWPTEKAAALIASARAAHVVTVADGAALSVCVPRCYRGDIVERLAACAADVLAQLHRQSDERMGFVSPRDIVG